jgi:hypothetical protein
MKLKIKNPAYTEIEIPNGYYTEGNDFYSLQEDKIVKVCIVSDYASIGTSVSEYDRLDLATPITKDEFEAHLETAFEIIRGKL